MEGDPHTLYGVCLSVQPNAQLLLQLFLPGKQQPRQLLHLLCRQPVRCQQHRFDPYGAHFPGLPGIGACRQGNGAVGAVSGGETLCRRAVHIQPPQLTLLCQLGKHRAGGACRNKQPVDLSRLQLGGGVLVVQVHGGHQLFVQAIGGKDLQGVLLGAGILRPDADGPALQLLHRFNAGIRPDDDLTRLGVQCCHRPKAAAFLLIPEDAGVLVCLLH